MRLDDELYCEMVEIKAVSHLFRCNIDDNILAVQNLGRAFAEALGPVVKKLSNGENDD